ncbi:esterase-like activity of phytase family protein [Maribius pontilimi]|uniref:Esterase-like activity of phytase family protein n=2 Tax=Palleronia pontilimi TaxID=1964209 RepID=A0A934IGG1_9RHOB|nr:esterase-like activity of phytase family protein [Palleronia pontilimi]
MMALTAAPTGAAEFLGAFAWQSDRADHGGFSGIEVSDDGTRFTALSDRARIVQGRFERADGRIVGIDADPPTVLTNSEGRRMRRTFGDSEGLALARGGGMHISFEGRARVWFYPAADRPPAPLPRHPDFAGLPENGALEALAVDATGALYTLPERAPDAKTFPVWRYDGMAWARAFTLPARGYAIVGADFDDRGRLYLLERKFRTIGFATRVRRITLNGSDVIADEDLLETRLREHDNLEGIAVWRDADGKLRLTMISDDNFNWLQRTEIVEYRVPG